MGEEASKKTVAETRQIDGTRFIINKLMGRQTVRMWYRLLESLLPAFGKAVGAFGPELGSVMNMDVSVVARALGGGAIQQLFQSLPEDKFMALVHGYFENVVAVHDGKSVSLSEDSMFDVVFQGRAETVIKLLMACVEVNHGRFLGRGGLVAGLLGAVREKVRPGSPETSATTSSDAGQSGDSLTLDGPASKR